MCWSLIALPIGAGDGIFDSRVPKSFTTEVTGEHRGELVSRIRTQDPSTSLGMTNLFVSCKSSDDCGNEFREARDCHVGFGFGGFDGADAGSCRGTIDPDRREA